MKGDEGERGTHIIVDETCQCWLDIQSFKHTFERGGEVVRFGVVGDRLGSLGNVLDPDGLIIATNEEFMRSI